ncbi:hypothetical protein HK405_001417, partial [Cladochytrium tenue]
MSTTPTIDLALYSICVGISTIVVCGTGWRLFAKIQEGGTVSLATLTSAGGLGFLVVAFAANVLYLGKTIVPMVYTNVNWLVPWPRFCLIYFLLNTSTVMLYFLYERRISLLFARKNRVVAGFYAWSLWFFMLAYYAVTVAIIVLRSQYAVNTASGGYASNPPNGDNLNVINYAIDMAIGFLILSGTTHALIFMISDSTSAAGQSMLIYRTILGSDCLKYAIIAGIEAYKLATYANISIAPAASIQHTIDAFKIAIMTFN